VKTLRESEHDEPTERVAVHERMGIARKTSFRILEPQPNILDEKIEGTEASPRSLRHPVAPQIESHDAEAPSGQVIRHVLVPSRVLPEPVHEQQTPSYLSTGTPRAGVEADSSRSNHGVL